MSRYLRRLQELAFSLLTGSIGVVCLIEVAVAQLTLTQPLVWSGHPDRANCPDETSFLWVRHDEGEDCIRYFGGTSLKGKRRVIVQLYGDRDGALRLAPEQIRLNTRDAQESYARRQSDKAGATVVILARPGTYGSSGDHRQRRTVAEFAAIDAALDALRNRYGIERWVLIGHSGGATAIAALLTRGRRDIQCAVMTSGAFQYLARSILWRMRRDRPLVFDGDALRIAQKYDPIEHVSGVQADPDRRVIVMGDARDTVTPFHLQALFAWEMQRHGHQATVETARGAPPLYHNLTAGTALDRAVSCMHEP